MTTIRLLGYIILAISLIYLIITMLIETKGKIAKPLRCWFFGHKWDAEPGYFRGHYAELQICKRCARKRAVIVKKSGEVIQALYVFVAREFKTRKWEEQDDTNDYQGPGSKN